MTYQRYPRLAISGPLGRHNSVELQGHSHSRNQPQVAPLRHTRACLPAEVPIAGSRVLNRDVSIYA